MKKEVWLLLTWSQIRKKHDVLDLDKNLLPAGTFPTAHPKKAAK
jgi:hypothetical protein